jgi:hypothetical protein
MVFSPAFSSSPIRKKAGIAPGKATQIKLAVSGIKENTPLLLFVPFRSHRGDVLIVAISPAPVLINRIVLLRPLDQRTNGLTELFPVFCQRIFHPRGNLRKRFTVNQVFLLEIFQHISKGLGTDAVKPLRNILEPDFPVVANDTDDQDSPFFCNNIDDPFERTQTDMITIVFHSHFKTLNLTLLILFN